MTAPTLKFPRQSAVEQFTLAGVTHGDRTASALPMFAAFLRAALVEHSHHITADHRHRNVTEQS